MPENIEPEPTDEELDAQIEGEEDDADWGFEDDEEDAALV